MSILANALTDHKLADYRDAAGVIERLSVAVSETRHVRNYWRSVDPQSVEARESWRIYQITHPAEREYLRYEGPGGFCVHFGARVATIDAACRWSGFATIPALQSVHATAFRALARALGGTRIVLIPEYDPVKEIAHYDSSSLDDCIALLERNWGPPLPEIATVTEDIKAYYRRKFPPWYVEILDSTF